MLIWTGPCLGKLLESVALKNDSNVYEVYLAKAIVVLMQEKIRRRDRNELKNRRCVFFLVPSCSSV